MSIFQLLYGCDHLNMLRKACLEWSSVGVCKKPRNQKNRFKPIETEPKFRFDRFQFYYVKNQKIRFGFQWQILIH